MRQVNAIIHTETARAVQVTVAECGRSGVPVAGIECWLPKSKIEITRECYGACADEAFDALIALPEWLIRDRNLGRAAL